MFLWQSGLILYWVLLDPLFDRNALSIIVSKMFLDKGTLWACVLLQNNPAVQ